jgi:putative transposase
MSNYVRYRVPGGCYFFTVNLLERKKHLLTEHIEPLRHAFRTVKQQRPFHIDAIVFLPEHLHCILTLPEGDDDFSGRWRAIKKIFSKQLPITEHRSDVRLKRHERGIWQRRFLRHAQDRFGNMPSVTKMITSGMLITFITIPLSMVG